MASSITFGGLASGLDTNAIVSALVSVEQRSVTALTTRKSALQSKADLFTRLKGLLDTLKSKADTLASADKVVAFSTSVSSDGYFKASASGAASAGTYDVEVTKLAQTARLVTNGYADSGTTTLGTGTLKITIAGTEHSIAIDSAHATLSGLKSAINDAGLQVKANIINDGSTNPYRLSIEGKDSGAANTVSIDASGLTGGGASLTFDGTLERVAQDASVKIDGITVARSTNTIADAIPGVTLTLTSKTTSALKLSVSVDRDKTRKNIQDFVDAYNAVVGFKNDQSRYDTTAKKSGPLSGDTTLHSAARQLAAIISGQVGGDDTDVRSLAAAGVKLGSDGKLSIDSTKLDQALDTNLASVVKLFSNSTDGIAGKVSTAVDRYTDSIDGLIKARQDGLSSSIRDLEAQITKAQDHVDDFQQRMIQKFASLEQLMTRLNQQGASLSGWTSKN
ncbi:MAG: flagellar filament capping protein FliD [Planctomycetota bacterium]